MISSTFLVKLSSWRPWVRGRPLGLMRSPSVESTARMTFASGTYRSPGAAAGAAGGTGGTAAAGAPLLAACAAARAAA